MYDNNLYFFKNDIMKIYISGQITGIEATALIFFETAEIFLTKKGYEVINPMKLNHNHSKTWGAFMKKDIAEMCTCDAIYLLNNWEKSKGAKMEFELATTFEMQIIQEGEI